MIFIYRLSASGDPQGENPLTGRQSGAIRGPLARAAARQAACRRYRALPPVPDADPRPVRSGRLGRRSAPNSNGRHPGDSCHQRRPDTAVPPPGRHRDRRPRTGHPCRRQLRQPHGTAPLETLRVDGGHGTVQVNHDTDPSRGIKRQGRDRAGSRRPAQRLRCPVAGPSRNVGRHRTHPSEHVMLAGLPAR
jgi:hypothetical protein